MKKVSSIPVYMRIVEEMKSRIKSGALSSGSHLPREIDFAKEFDVTRSTLRNAFDVLEREGFIERRRSKGTFITPDVKRNAHLHPDLAIVTQLDLTQPTSYAPLFEGGDESASTIAAATKRGMLLRFIPWGEDFRFFNLDEIILKKGIDGYIFVSPLYLTDFIDRVVDEKIPHVLQESHYDKRSVNSVVTDDEQAVRESLLRLYELGHRRIAFCAGPLKRSELNSAARRRHNTFLKVACELGLERPNAFSLTYGENDWKNTHRDMTAEIKELLLRNDRPTALIASSQRIARSVLRACLDLNLNVPEEVSLISCGGNDPNCEVACDAYAKNYELLGERIIDSLMNWIADPLFKPKCEKIAPDYIEKGTIALCGRCV